MNETIKKDKSGFGEKAFNFLLDNKALVILAILAIGLAIATPNFATSKNLINVLRQVSYTVCMGVGFTLILASGNIDLSVGYMLGFLGIVSALLGKTGLAGWIVIPVTLLLGGCFGAINGFLGTVLKIPLFIATLGMQQIFKGMSQLISHNQNVTALPNWYITIGQGSLGPIPIPVCIMIVAGIIGILVVKYTQFGRYVLAVGGNRMAATACGINANGITRRAYIIMGICAAVGALILTGRASSAQVSAGQGMEMDAIAACVIGGTSLMGGRAKVIGTIFGCLIVGVITNGLNILGAATAWQVIGKGIMILLAVLLDTQATSIINKRLTRRQKLQL